jgi:aryl sulfotransferase
MTESALPQREHMYLTLVSDSERWDRYVPRRGDIIISTPPKTGTTWTQMICALLIFQTPKLDRRLSEISPWFDMRASDIDEVVATYEAQTHRRFIKTHTPLDGLPYFEEVTYLYCGRDPRDVFFSFQNHAANISDAMMSQILNAAGLEEFPTLSEDPDELFSMWLTIGATPWMEDGFPFGSVFYHTLSFWKYRHLPNIHLLHYGDMKADLEGEMRRLASHLGIEVEESRWPELVAAATFESMKQRAGDLAPLAEKQGWKDDSRFFNKGQTGQWRGLLKPESLALYDKIVRERYPADMAEWLHQGRLAQAAR